MKKNVCVWIDHFEARFFDITMSDVEKRTLVDDRPKHHIHRKADHVHRGKKP